MRCLLDHHPRFALERESKSFALALMAAQHWREWAMYVHMWSLASAMGRQERSVLTLVPAVTHRAKAKRRQEEELTRQFLETEMKLKQQAIDEKEYSCVRGSFSCLLAQLSPSCPAYFLRTHDTHDTRHTAHLLHGLPD